MLRPWFYDILVGTHPVLPFSKVSYYNLYMDTFTNPSRRVKDILLFSFRHYRYTVMRVSWKYYICHFKYLLKYIFSFRFVHQIKLVVLDLIVMCSLKHNGLYTSVKLLFQFIKKDLVLWTLCIWNVAKVEARCHFALCRFPSRSR